MYILSTLYISLLAIEFIKFFNKNIYTLYITWTITTKIRNKISQIQAYFHFPGKNVQACCMYRIAKPEILARNIFGDLVKKT